MIYLKEYVGCILMVKTYQTRFLTITKVLEETFNLERHIDIYVNDANSDLPFHFYEKTDDLLDYKEVTYGDGDSTETYQILPNSELTKVLYLD